MEKKYEFKLDLLKVHKSDVRRAGLLPEKDEYELKNGLTLVLPEYDEDDVILTAAKDFIDYLFVSQGVSAMLGREAMGAECLTISLNRDLGDAAGYMGYRLTVTKTGISLEGYDVRGVAQGLYALEDMMNLRRAPFVKHGVVARRALFRSRLTNSPYGMLEYNDAALSLIAHCGMDTIELWIDNPFTTQRGDYIDMRLLSERAARYGIDIAILMRAPHDKHPTDPGAQAHYDAMYGDLMTACPRIKYITLEGENTHFKSHDPAVCARSNVDGIPTGVPTPGWWPCSDYPDWVRMILSAVRKHSDTAEVIFSTYNWGFAPEEDRVRLIENLPDGIIHEATWDMFQRRRIGDSVSTVPDYSLSFVGPGDYFKSEAIAVAKRPGLRLAANSQTSGRTWDFGVVPYEPMPGQWIKRYEAMQKAHEEWGLSYINENIHYGFYPSFILDIEKEAFFTNGRPLNEMLSLVLSRDFEKNADRVKEACDLLDEAITHYVPTNEDQYTAYRIGPSYPIVFDPHTGKRAARNKAMFGNAIYRATYVPDVGGKHSPSGVRFYDEVKEGEVMRDLLLRALEILKACPAPNEKLKKLTVLVEFIYRSVLTALANKEMHLLRSRFFIARTREEADELLDAIEALMRKERENVVATIPLVQADSRLGWEPSMEYACDEDALRWKLDQLDYELNTFIPKTRAANALVDIYK